MVALADQLLALVKTLDPSLEFKYNKFHIGLSQVGHDYNFVTFRLQKNDVNFELKRRETDDLDTKIEETGLETLEYKTRSGLDRLRLAPRTSKRTPPF